MRTIRYCFPIFLTACLLLSCTPEIDIMEDSFRSSHAELSGSGQNLKVLFDASAGSASMELSSNMQWEASFLNERASWCSLSSESGKKGTVTLTVSVQANTTYEERSASIAFTCKEARQTIVVVQKQNDAVLLSSSKLEVPEKGGNFSFEVRHNIDYSAVVDDAAASWIRILSTKGLAANKVSLQVDPNEAFSSRSGKIYVRSTRGEETVTVFQEAATPTIVLTQKEYTLPDTGEAFAVEIKSNVDYEYEILEGASWLSEVKTKSMSTHTLHFAAAANETYDNRTGKIRFSDKEFGLAEEVTVHQKQKDALLLTWNEFDVSDAGEVITVEVKSNIQFAVDIPEGAEWISAVRTKGLTTHTLKFEIKANGTYDARDGIIRFSDQESGLVEEVKVHQKQKDALFLTESEYSVPAEGGLVSMEVTSNIDFECEIAEGGDWISEIRTKSLSSRIMQFEIKENKAAWERRGTVVFRDRERGIEQKAVVIQKESDVEKLILLSLLDACTDEDWKTRYIHSHGWKEDRPLTDWGRVRLNEDGRVDSLNLFGFKGTIPDAVGGLSSLKVFQAENGALDGFPVALFQCKNLETLELSFANLSGTIPEGIGVLEKLSYLDLHANEDLCGRIPESLLSLPCWKCFPLNVISGTGLEVSSSDFVAPEFDLTDIDGGRLDSRDLYSRHPYTILYDCSIRNASSTIINNLKKVRVDRPDVEIAVFVHGGETEQSVREFRDKKDIAFPCVALTGEVAISGQTGYTSLYMKEVGCPNLLFVLDRSGNVVYFWGPDIAGSFSQDIYTFMTRTLGREDGYYASVDYSRDGEVTVLQEASEGKGIDLVFMGDGYSDRFIADGTYMADINQAVEGFFCREPYKSFRHLFNVYAVTAVSKNDQYDKEYGTETAFQVDISGSNGLKCSDLSVVKSYAGRALGDDKDRVNHSTITTVVRSYAGRSICYLGDPYKGSSSEAFCVKSSEDYLLFVVGHEAGGHGFSRLGDEYEDAGVAATKNMESFRNSIGSYHDKWQYRNLDITGDPEKIVWSKFLSIPAYAERVGVFEGGYYVPTGVYRPAENSIMRSTRYGGGYNAPSREAIYYRIHKMAYGEEWVYDFNEFLEYDQINLMETSPAPGYPGVLRAPSVPEIDMRELTAPPIIKDDFPLHQ